MPTNPIAIRPVPINCQATLLRPATPGNARWRFLRLPQQASAQLPSRGIVSVEAALNGHAFRATLDPDGNGSHWLKLPAALCKASGVKAGDAVTLTFAPATREPAPRIPPDLRKALAQAPAAKAQWVTLTPEAAP